MGLGARFALAMSGALIVTATIFGWLLATGVQRADEDHLQLVLQRSLETTAAAEERGWRTTTDEMVKTGRVLRQPVEIGGKLQATKYTVDGASDELRLMVPENLPPAGQDALPLIAAGLLGLVLVGAGVSFYVGRQVTKPLDEIIADVRQLSSGNLRWRGRAKGGAEIALLSRSLERMAEDLQAAREAELELLTRDEELEIAEDVRESLNPMTTPLAPGVDLAAAHLPCRQLSGAFHDFVEFGDGRFGVLVGDVSGHGTQAAILGSMARAWLQASLEEQSDVAAALSQANRKLSGRLRAGSYVTLLYALVDAAEGKATVACCGHRMPLLRESAADGKLRTFQPEGIALGLDPGAVFDRALEIQNLEFAPGDRLVLCTSGAAAVAPKGGEELGSRGLYRAVHAGVRGTPNARRLLKAIRAQLEEFSEGAPFPDGISIVTLARDTAEA